MTVKTLSISLQDVDINDFIGRQVTSWTQVPIFVLSSLSKVCMLKNKGVFTANCTKFIRRNKIMDNQGQGNLTRRDDKVWLKLMKSLD